MLDDKQAQRITGMDLDCAHAFDITCENCRMRALCMPAALSPEEIRVLEQTIDGCHALPAHEPVYRIGDPFKAVYAIIEGAVKGSMTDAHGQVTVVDFHFPGELFGFSGISEGHFSSSAQTLVPTLLCELPFEELESACRGIPGLQSRLLHLMSDRIVDYQEHLAQIRTTRSAKMRLAMFLLSLSARAARRGESSSLLRLPMTGQEIASYLGISAEAVSRGFSSMSADGLLVKQQREISLLDLKRLREFVCP